MRLFSSAIVVVWASYALANPLIQFFSQPILPPAHAAIGISEGHPRAPSVDVLGRRDGPLPKCAPPEQAVNSRRAFNGLRLEASRNITLLVERMKLPGSDMSRFYAEELPEADPIVTEHRKSDINTAILMVFKQKKDYVEYSAGTMGLCGCTTMVLVSRKAVYATHWWENIAFAPDPPFRKDPAETDAEVFKRTVLDAIEMGIKTPAGYILHDQLVADKIADDYIKAYLVRPDKTWQDVQDGYRDQWDLIKKKVGDIIPLLKEESRWKEITYTRLPSNDRRLQDTPAGKVLFKFDPDHNGKRKAALWVEGEAKPFHDEEWTDDDPPAPPA